jgi:hypothetical protein
LSPLRLRFTLEEAGVVFRVDAVNDIVNYQISDVELVYQATELSPAAQASIDEMTGGNTTFWLLRICIRLLLFKQQTLN